MRAGRALHQGRGRGGRPLGRAQARRRLGAGGSWPRAPREPRATSASRGRPKARAAPTHPGAPPLVQLRRSPWPPGRASAAGGAHEGELALPSGRPQRTASSPPSTCARGGCSRRAGSTKEAPDDGYGPHTGARPGRVPQTGRSPFRTACPARTSSAGDRGSAAPLILSSPGVAARGRALARAERGALRRRVGRRGRRRAAALAARRRLSGVTRGVAHGRELARGARGASHCEYACTQCAPFW